MDKLSKDYISLDGKYDGRFRFKTKIGSYFFATEDQLKIMLHDVNKYELKELYRDKREEKHIGQE